MSRHRTYTCARAYQGCFRPVRTDGDVCTECKARQKKLLDRQFTEERRRQRK